MTFQHDHKAVVGVFHSRSAADGCFGAFIRRGYLSSDINLMMSDRTRTQDYVWGDEDPALATTDIDLMASDGDGATVAVSPVKTIGTAAGSKATQGIGVGGGIGTAVGATLAAIAAVGTSLTIPGLNLIVAGPLLAALAGGGAGAVAGGLVGGLVGLGIPEQDAEIYNQALRDGGVVMSVAARSEDVYDVQNLMIQHGGEQVSSCKC